MERNIKTAVHNRFDFEVADAVSGEIKQRYTSYNIITNYFFERLMVMERKLYGIQIGTGTGELSQTRRSLFAYLGCKVAETVECVKSYPTSYIRKKIVLRPGDFVGQRITEVGYSPSDGQGYIVSHSLLKDSEGNQIAIEKTATDVITIYATFYLTIGQPPDDSYVLTKPDTNIIIKCVLEDTYPWPDAIIGGYAPLQYADEMEQARILQKSTIRFSGNTTTNVWTFPTTRFDYNEANVHMVQSVGSSKVAAWRLPNSTTFPNVLLEQIAVGTGDGATTVFNCPVPSIVPQSEKIRKNGVLLERGTDYTIDYENNQLELPELFISSDPNNYDVTGGTMTSNSGMPLIEFCGYSVTPFRGVMPDAPIIYDFRHPITINRFKIAGSSITTTPGTYFGMSTDLHIDYSTDGENWTNLFTSGSLYTQSIQTDQWLDPEITARYFRLTSTASQALSANVKPCILFGYITPGLTFTTAPAEGDIITMDCQVNRPFKNENWVLDFGFTVSFERA